MNYHAAQFRAARAILDLGTREVAAATKMSFRSLSEIEQPTPGKNVPSESSLTRLIEFYEAQGITFLSGGRVGRYGIRFETTCRGR